jgi:hypothetical protein
MNIKIKIIKLTVIGVSVMTESMGSNVKIWMKNIIRVQNAKKKRA